jgi:hypothetical protein
LVVISKPPFRFFGPLVDASSFQRFQRCLPIGLLMRGLGASLNFWSSALLLWGTVGLQIALPQSEVQVRIQAETAGNCKGKRDFVYGYYPFGKGYYMACLGGRSVTSEKTTIPQNLIDQFRATRRVPKPPKPPTKEELAQQKALEDERRVADALRNWKPDPTPVRRVDAKNLEVLQVGMLASDLEKILGKPNASALIPEEEGYSERRTFLVNNGGTAVVILKNQRIVSWNSTP